MADFHEVRFPDTISKGSQGGPGRRTDIVELVSGFEERNAAQAHSRREYDAGMGIRNVNDLYAVIEFWEARFGQLYGFRWKDWADFKSGQPRGPVSPLDQDIGTGDGTETVFQLKKTYASGGHGYVRPISKPVTGTVRIAVNGTEMGSGFVVDHTTGQVTFDTAPANEAVITAGFEFDVPVRFKDASIAISIDAFYAGSVPAINIKEVRV